jgi:Cu(I)/Ag(I) efflux system membrane fusion protein
MNKNVRVVVLLATGIAIGLAAMWFCYPFFSKQSADSTDVSSTEKEKKPLYWVAPMDPNYKRDKPGKSPMGMDLIPVYQESDDGAGPGTVKISPDVVNNLGVRVARVEQRNLHSMIRTVGYVGYDEDQLTHIHPRVQGWIEKLYVKASGDPIKQGEPLYEIYSPELVNAQEELVLALDRKAARLIEASENRLKALRVPPSLITQLKKTRKVKQTITFYAPRSGVVDNMAIREGFFVKPGSTIMSIGTLKQVWVVAEVFERQAPLVKKDLPVTMTLDYLPGRKWLGEVDYIYPTLDAQTRTIRVRLRFQNNDDLLKPNMFAQVVIHANSPEKTLVVPREAVIRTGGSNRVVLALGGGRFKSINVQVGRFDEQYAEILSGLSKNEKVVVSAQFLIDSESSKTSDFKRMNHKEETRPSTVRVIATINSIMKDQRMINVTHGAVPAWQWPKMTMDFNVADNIDLDSLARNMEILIRISAIDANQYRITDISEPGRENENKNLDELSLDGMDLDELKE